jgi:hypothetical protein
VRVARAAVATVFEPYTQLEPALPMATALQQRSDDLLHIQGFPGAGLLYCAERLRT